MEDQINIPENKRPFPSAKNPHASATLYQSQEQLKKLKEMEDPEWYPKNTKYNIYNQKKSE